MAASKEKVSPERKIIDAALETIAEQNISGTRMRHIAKNAGMSQGNLHYYFPTKADLYRALLEDMLRVFVSDREQDIDNSSLSPKEALAVFFSQEEEILERRSNMMNVFFDFWVQGTRDPEIRKQIQGMYAAWRRDLSKVVSRGVEQGVFDSRYAELVPGLVVSLMDGGALQYLIERKNFDLKAYLTSAYEMVLRMLGTTSEENPSA